MAIIEEMELIPLDNHPLRPHYKKNLLLYCVLIGGALLLAVSLPLISIDISVRSTGVIHAAMEATAITASHTGFVEKIFVKENEAVNKNQLLFIQRAPDLDEKISFLQKQITDLRYHLHDLDQLTKYLMSPDSNKTHLHLSTPLYSQSFMDFNQRKHERELRLEKIHRDYNRNKKLFDQNVITAVEFDNVRLAYTDASGELETLVQTQVTTWTNDRKTYHRDLLDKQNELKLTECDATALHIRATLKGTIQNLTGVYTGTFLTTGQSITSISPDTALIAEVFVLPSDIGLLIKGMKARIHIDAFNHNQWGYLMAVIHDISSDVILIDKQPAFKVKCRLESTFLSLPNGYQGHLKKGMTLQARFLVTRRTLWQLLYDKADDWLSPNSTFH